MPPTRSKPTKKAREAPSSDVEEDEDSEAYAEVSGDEDDDLSEDDAPQDPETPPTQPPQIDDPYKTLNIPSTATDSEIKKSYRKLSLIHHPDKAVGSHAKTAHEDFQRITAAYALLSNPQRRRIYDETGSTAEVLFNDDENFSWVDFYREKYADVVTEEKIQSFSDGYKGSEEERGDLLKAYTRAKGNMDKVYSQVMLSEVLEDDERFRKTIDEAIEKGEVEGFELYTQETEKHIKARIDRAKKRRNEEAKEAKEHGENIKKAKAKKSGGDGLGDLAAMIRGKGRGGGDDFLSRLEEKYASGGKKGKRSEPPEEAFARNAKKTKGKK